LATQQRLTLFVKQVLMAKLESERKGEADDKTKEALKKI
jgi:hypothetical protein